MKKKLITIIIAASLGCSMLIGCENDTATIEKTTSVENTQVNSNTSNNEVTVSDDAELTKENKQLIAEMEKYLEDKYGKKFYIDNNSLTPHYKDKTDTLVDWRVSFSDTLNGEKTNTVSKNIYYNYCEDDYWVQIADKSLLEDKCKKVLKEYGFNCDVKMEFVTVPVNTGYYENFTGNEINSNSTKEEWLDLICKSNINIKIYMLDYSEITDDLIKSVKYALTGHGIHNAGCYIFNNTEINKNIENKAIDFDLIG